MFDLARDEIEEPLAHARRGDEQPPEGRHFGTAGEVMEQADHVGRDHRVARQQPDVRVQPRRADVVVAGADMRVAAQPPRFLADDERDLGVRLERQAAHRDVCAGALELRCPMQVALLVETRLQLDDAGHLLARFRCLDQRANEGRVVADAVNRHLDRDGARVVRGGLDEPVDALVEAVEGMMNEQITGLNGLED